MLVVTLGCSHYCWQQICCGSYPTNYQTCVYYMYVTKGHIHSDGVFKDPHNMLQHNLMVTVMVLEQCYDRISGWTLQWATAVNDFCWLEELRIVRSISIYHGNIFNRYFWGEGLWNSHQVAYVVWALPLASWCSKANYLRFQAFRSSP